MIIIKLLYINYFTSTGIRPKDSGSKISGITISLVTVSLMFILTTGPGVVYRVSIDNWINVGFTEYELALSDLRWAILTHINWLNNCINFVLFILLSPSFRKEFFALFTCRKCRKHNNKINPRQTTSVQKINLKPEDNTPITSFVVANLNAPTKTEPMYGEPLPMKDNAKEIENKQENSTNYYKPNSRRLKEEKEISAKKLSHGDGLVKRKTRRERFVEKLKMDKRLDKERKKASKAQDEDSAQVMGHTNTEHNMMYE